jgi:integrase
MDWYSPTTLDTHSNLRRAIERLCGLADIDPVSPNELRHTAATLLVDTGMRLEEVADFLGHKDTSMLIETYRHRAKRVVDLTGPR